MIDRPSKQAPPGAVLVTGAAKRIGRAIALGMADAGWAVAVHYHGSETAAAEVVSRIEAAGGRAVALRCDLSRESEVEMLVERAVGAVGPLTCLVNNASLFEMDTVDTATRESWDAHIETNLRAPLVLSQAFARQMPEDVQGNIINLLDQRVWKLTPYFLSYTVSKMGLWTLTRTLALALAPHIRVNGIGPGPTLPSPKQTVEQFEELCNAVPLGHGTTPEEICEAVLFLLSAPAITGQMIALDGGEHLGWALPSRGYVKRE
ncbi:SDR family oxidoreductase [Rhodospirillaceae bacterium SYSU D60014]|uniref:SDR family oxidoreductase n=1 Tax=Virgifigura deserti TaxID=2268457 RepID=UPI000E66E9AC